MARNGASHPKRAWSGELGRSIEALSARERVVYYRGMAAEAVLLAKTANDGEQKASFLDCASRWLSLAHEVENLQEHLAGFRRRLGELRRRHR